MSNDDAAGLKSGHDTAAKLDDYPGQWRPAANADDAYLRHGSGAKLIVRRTAPPTQPAPDETARDYDCYELNFQPADTQHLRVLIRSGAQDGLRDAARSFARENPDANPDDEAFAFPAAWEGDE